MSIWDPCWELHTIPDDLWRREFGRRMRLKPSSGVAKKLKPCEFCGDLKGVAEMRAHRPACRRLLKQGVALATPKNCIDCDGMPRSCYMNCGRW